MENHTRNEALLEISRVSLSFGSTLVLRDVNAEVRDLVRPGHTQGQVVGLLGPSGIGKSQLFRIIAGLQEPTAGSVFVGAAKEVARRGLVGMVAQNYPLFEHRTALGNLLVSARQRGESFRCAKEQSLALLERFGLGDRADFYPAQLSGGQRQRVAIAQQILCSEHFLLMDEPFSGLDLIMLRAVCKLISEVAGMHELNTLIVCTHDIASAVCVSDTLWLLGRDRDERGEPIAGARVQECYDLIERGLAWREDVMETPEFAEFLRELRVRFATL